uniref:NUDIX domain-containing protein n=1 Tax=Fervidobacterium nodosum TaxID=2424 RepID=A0A7C5Y4G4_9BACT
MDYKTLIEKLRRDEKQRLAVICYASYEDKILFMKRKNEPFAGFLVPPGGKVEDNEGIEEAIRREFKEETGLELKNLEVKMVTSEIGPEKYNWILFIFTAKVDSQNTIDCEEGKLVWIEKEKLLSENLSPIDKLLVPYILDDGLKIAFIDYSNEKTVLNLEIVEIDKYQKNKQ